MKQLLTICFLLIGMIGNAQTTVTVTLFDETFAGNQINYPQHIATQGTTTFNNGVVIGSVSQSGFVLVEVPLEIQVNKTNIKLNVEYSLNAGYLVYYKQGNTYDTLRGSSKTINYSDLSPVGTRITAFHGMNQSKITRIQVTYDSTYTEDPTGIAEDVIPDLEVFSYANKISLSSTQELSVNLFNHLGQTVYATKVSGKNEVEVHQAGIYFVCITDSQNRKLVKKLYLSN